MFGGADTPGRIHFRHRIGMYARELVRPATVYDDQLYAFLGDVIGGQAPQTVAWPMYAFCTML
jgi:hypothetical protein